MNEKDIAPKNKYETGEFSGPNLWKEDLKGI